jgi:2-amino-4-hydroxy-6-hydroxymethyldihydropteridine diphosphokinase
MIFVSPEVFTSMNQAYLLIGGNLGNREQNLARARKEIETRAGLIIEASALYQTAAWGKTDQPDFLNQVLKIETSLDAGGLIDQLLSAELAMGRHRNEKYGPRTIDMDILFFNDDIIDNKTLQVPHPRLQERRFALIPLAEIAGGKIHPVLGSSINELLANCPDKLPVYKFTGIVNKKEK